MFNQISRLLDPLSHDVLAQLGAALRAWAEVDAAIWAAVIAGCFTVWQVMSAANAERRRILAAIVSELTHLRLHYTAVIHDLDASQPLSLRRASVGPTTFLKEGYLEKAKLRIRDIAHALQLLFYIRNTDLEIEADNRSNGITTALILQRARTTIIEIDALLLSLNRYARWAVSGARFAAVRLQQRDERFREVRRNAGQDPGPLSVN